MNYPYGFDFIGIYNKYIAANRRKFCLKLVVVTFMLLRREHQKYFLGVKWNEKFLRIRQLYYVIERGFFVDSRHENI